MPEMSQSFSTPPSSSHNANGKSETTGLHGTKKTLPDGTILISATEDMKASRQDGLDGSLTASWKWTQVNDVISVEQRNYSYTGREIPAAGLFTKIGEFPLDVIPGFTASDVLDVIASQFGKNDKEDEGTGSPDMGTVQTNSEVIGASLKISVMKSLFSQDWKENAKRLGALAEIYNPDTLRLARVPLVDVGPGESIPAEIDLTWATDQFLGTGGQASVQYRVLIPDGD